MNETAFFFIIVVRRHVEMLKFTNKPMLDLKNLKFNDPLIYLENSVKEFSAVIYRSYFYYEKFLGSLTVWKKGHCCSYSD